MNQTSGRHRMPNLSTDQISDLSRVFAAAKAACPPIECRLHPDDWDAVRAMLPSTPKGLTQVSLFADLGIGSPAGRFTEVRIVLDRDAPRLPKKGGTT